MSQAITTKGISEGLQRAGNALRRRMSIIYVVTVLGALIYSVFSVNLILSAPTDTQYMSEKEASSYSTRFDEATIKKIDSLKSRQDAGSVELPGGRINPFAE